MLYHLRSVCQCFSHPTACGRHVWSLPSSVNAVSPQIRESMLQPSHCMWKACLVLVVSATPYPLQIMLCRFRSLSQCFSYPNAFGRHMFGPRCSLKIPHKNSLVAHLKIHRLFLLFIIIITIIIIMFIIISYYYFY